MAPDNLVGLEIGVTVPFVILCVGSFALRVYSRACIAKSFGLDDWMMVAAFFGWVGQQAITYSWVAYGAGLHQSQVPPDTLLGLETLLFVEEFYYLFEQLLIKMSFLLFYLRFLGDTDFCRIIYLTMALVCLQVSGTWIFYGLQCRPIQAYWFPAQYPDAVCFTTGIAYYAPTAANILVDVIIYLVPIYPLWNLQASLQKRLGLMAVMTLGGLTILVSCLRFIVLYQLATEADFTFIFGRVVIVTTIEFVTAIVTANMPAIKSIWTFHVAARDPDPSSACSGLEHEMPGYRGQRGGGRVGGGSDSDGSAGAQKLGAGAGAYLRRTTEESYRDSRSDDLDFGQQRDRRASVITITGPMTTGRPPSATDSEEGLVKSKGGGGVVVTSEWEVESESRPQSRATVRQAQAQTKKNIGSSLAERQVWR